MKKLKFYNTDDVIKDFFKSIIKESNFNIIENTNNYDLYEYDLYEMRFGPFYIISESEYKTFNSCHTFFVVWGLNKFFEYDREFNNFYLLDAENERNVKLLNKFIEYIRLENNINKYFGE